MGFFSSPEYRSRRISPPMSFLNTRWGRDETIGRHRPGEDGTPWSQSAYAIHNARSQGQQPGVWVRRVPTGERYAKPPATALPTHSSATSAYLADLRSPTKLSVSRTPQPRCFSPPRRGTTTSAQTRTLKRKAAFEPRPTALNERSPNVTTSLPPPSYSGRLSRQSEPRRSFNETWPSQPKPRVEVKTTYALKTPTNFSLPTGQRRPTAVAPTTTPPSPKTRLYNTSSVATPLVPKTSPPSVCQTPKATSKTSPPPLIRHVPYPPHANPGAPPALNPPRSAVTVENDRTRRRQGFYAIPAAAAPSPTSSPPRAYRRVESHARLHSETAATSQPSASVLTKPSPTNATRFPISSSTNSRPSDPPSSHPRPLSSQPMQATTQAIPSSRKPSVEAQPGPTHSYRASYRYPSLSSGTAATPKRRINAGMVPIDTTSSSPSVPARRTFLAESPTRHSKYPRAQRQGVVVDGEKERAFRGWLRRGGESSTRSSGGKSKIGGFGLGGDVGMAEMGGGRDWKRRMKRRGKGVWFWEWSPS